MNRFIKNIPRDILEKDLSGILYDRPVYGGGFLTRHARKRCDERNIDKKDAILNKPSANTIEREGFIITVLGDLAVNHNNKNRYNIICQHCKKKGHIKKHCKKLKQERINRKGKKNNKIKHIKCENCDKLIKSNNYINHKCEIGFNCECSKSFKSKIDLMNHKRDKPNCVSKTIKKTIQLQPIEKCVHDWTCLKDRLHNKGDGKGKYSAYKCIKCKAFQRRYL